MYGGDGAKRNLVEVIDFAEEKIRMKVIDLYSASAVEVSLKNSLENRLTESMIVMEGESKQKMLGCL